MQKLTDEMIAKAADEVEQAFVNMFSKAEDCQHEFSPKFEQKMKKLLDAAQQQEMIDITGTPLTPSYHGKDCLGNGKHPGVECCCDNCNHYLECFPDWRAHT